MKMEYYNGRSYLNNKLLRVLNIYFIIKLRHCICLDNCNHPKKIETIREIMLKWITRFCAACIHAFRFRKLDS